MGDIAKRVVNYFEAEPDFDKSVIYGFTATEYDCEDKYFLGYKVVDSADLINKNIKLFIIASTTFCEEIYDSIKSFEKRGIKIKKINQYL